MRAALTSAFTASRWSGGSTVELCLYPPQGSYQKRDFLWRLSSATVDCAESDFTSLPDFERVIALLGGELTLDVGGEGAVPLALCQPYRFDGATPVRSHGRAVDLNLMLRKGRCEGEMRPLKRGVTLFGPRAGYAHATHLLYAPDPMTVRWGDEGTVMAAGSLLRLDGAEEAAVSAEPAGRAMAASVWY